MDNHGAHYETLIKILTCLAVTEKAVYMSSIVIVLISEG